MSENAAIPNATAAPALPAKRRGWLTLVLLVVVFASGLVCGAGGAIMAIRHGMRQAILHPETRPARGAHWLARRLDLTPEQERQVLAALQAQNAEFMALRREVWPRVIRRLDATEEEIARALTPEQQAAWRRLTANLRETWLPREP